MELLLKGTDRGDGEGQQFWRMRHRDRRRVHDHKDEEEVILIYVEGRVDDCHPPPSPYGVRWEIKWNCYSRARIEEMARASSFGGCGIEIGGVYMTIKIRSESVV